MAVRYVKVATKFVAQSKLFCTFCLKHCKSETDFIAAVRERSKWEQNSDAFICLMNNKSRKTCRSVTGLTATYVRTSVCAVALQVSFGS